MAPIFLVGTPLLSSVCLALLKNCRTLASAPDLNLHAVGMTIVEETSRPLKIFIRSGKKVVLSSLQKFR